MDTNKIEDRLKLYELALADYEASLDGNGDIKDSYGTYIGFCTYFQKWYKINLGFNFESILPELYEYKPIDRFVYWFAPGDIQPRIDCLKKAIELTKSKNNQ